MVEHQDRGVDQGRTEGTGVEVAFTDLAFTEMAFTEDELTALALAADPCGPIDDDAVPVAQYLGEHAGLLPSWYMPSPMARGGSRWRIPVVVAIVAAFVIIEAFGLCSTFGQLVPA